MDCSNRRGIAAAGNWIVDRVKVVDALPSRGRLGSIQSETRSTGGAAANVLMDLARLGAPFPLTGIGWVGADEDGAYVRSRFEGTGVDVSLVRGRPDARTSYTDVMSEAGTGDRTFYHHRGANALLRPEDVPLAGLGCRILHLGYLLLLDAMDEADEEFGTRAARLLHDARALGIRTSVDVVSEEGDRFRRIAPPALKHTDCLIINEVEAAAIAGIPVRDSAGALDPAGLEGAMEALAEMGTMECVVVHMPEGGCALLADGARRAIGSQVLPAACIAGSTGAGDAFCAGILFGLHEGWPMTDCLRLAVCSATACLSAEDACTGLRPVADVLALGDAHPWRDPPIW